MVGGKRSPNGATSIARCWLNPDIFEPAIAQYLAVCDAIERHAAGHAQIWIPVLLCQVTRQPQHYLVEDLLNGGGDVHMLLRQRRVFVTCRQSENRFEFRVDHRQPGTIVEI